jgi:hypothetical protein
MRFNAKDAKDAMEHQEIESPRRFPGVLCVLGGEYVVHA